MSGSGLLNTANLKGRMKVLILIPIVIIVALQAYIRLAPIHAKEWHVDPFTAQPPQEGGVLDIFQTEVSSQAALEAYHAVALSTPRTKLLAGSVHEGRVSYVTRSLLWGFPDVTTIGAQPSETGSQIAMLARLRFGKGDMGVNGKRVAAWKNTAGL
ncbi:uncharacterized protein DUF1499 [Pacificibacter maritimus]|uniref:Uncharacterized protein DUF1499 n=1 Tax=Pacificibacter maritimus TaxID=762213 RepID=A0A3N4ULW0_9RHOB|nr:DUF1499 domain-containing protein [Pacificibacter maritimus]RPE71626.1 uncharacterized protein DUF1499 [Pacificibacter maritimus]